MSARFSVLLLMAVFAFGNAQAASLYAGQYKAATVCAQCHGIKMPAVGAPFPPLAGRDVEYLRTALKQYRDKTRRSDVMNAIAGSLSDSDINDITAYYGNLKP